MEERVRNMKNVGEMHPPEPEAVAAGAIATPAGADGFFRIRFASADQASPPPEQASPEHTPTFRRQRALC